MKYGQVPKFRRGSKNISPLNSANGDTAKLSASPQILPFSVFFLLFTLVVARRPARFFSARQPFYRTKTSFGADHIGAATFFARPHCGSPVFALQANHFLERKLASGQTASGQPRFLRDHVRAATFFARPRFSTITSFGNFGAEN